MKTIQFTQQGRRSNNEDSLGVSKGLLTVCDGMGGHNYGERASAFVTDALIKRFDKRAAIGKIEIQQSLNEIQTNLNKLLDTEPELERMGSTFTGVFMTPDVWYAAHIGDSRIYLIQPSRGRLWHTWDHSFVGELMRTHEITVEAGRFHPMSNRISKAIIAQTGGKPVSASIAKIDSLQEGDILLLCSDGVVEAWGDWDLVNLFADKTKSFEAKCELLRRRCDETSKDNNTAIVAQIEAADAFAFGSNDELDWTSFAEVEADYNLYMVDQATDILSSDKAAIKVTAEPQPSANNSQKPQAESTKPQPSPNPVTDHARPRRGKRRFTILLLVAIVVLVGLVLALRYAGSSDKQQQKDPTESEMNDSVVKPQEKHGKTAQPNKQPATCPAPADKEQAKPDQKV